MAGTIGDSYTSALRGAKGVAFNQVGVTSVFVNARGFDVPLNTRMLMIEDGRLAVLAETGLPVGALTTIPKVDLAGVEVLVGPGSALYGPNASNGVIALRTKDPRQSPGWTVDVSGGVRNFHDLQARYAGVAGQWGYKVAGEYQAADDWTDVVFYPAIAPGGSPIRERGTDYHTTSMRASGSLSRYFDSGARLQLTSGMSERDGLGKTALGRTQVADYRYRNYQMQYSGARWFAQAYMTHSNTGRTFNLNSFSQNSVRYATLPADSVMELSRVPADGRLHALEIQNNFSVGMIGRTGIAAVDNAHVTWGGQFRRDRVSSYGHQLSDRRTGRPIHIEERGIYAQLESPLSSAIRLVAAARYDKNSRYPAQFSPKATVLLTSGDQTWRLTYNRAYRAPGILWTDTYYPDVQPNVGVFGNVDGFDIQDGNGAVVKAYAPVKSETSDTWEAGYKGVLRDRLYADVTAYLSTYRDFLTNAAVIANPFAPSPTTAYNHRTGEMVTGENGQRIVTLSFFNVGAATTTGIDAGVRYYLTDRMLASSSVTLARLNSLETKPGDPPDASGFNTSPARVTGTVELIDVPKRARQAVTVRYVNGYDFRAGVHYGHLPSFATLDFTASYRPLRSRTTVVLQAQNLLTCVGGTVTPPASGISPTTPATYTAGRRCGFGERHHELLNMPAVGAMVFLGVRWEGG
jgi:iron complex outermembrane receptor protein